MSVSKPSQDEAGRRNLPSWMNKGESPVKKPTGVRDSDENNEGEKPKQDKGDHSKRGSGAKVMENNKKSSASSSGTGNFSKLMEGVVFVLSGFVNPERGVLRSQAMEMGAEYQPDWNSGCTLLVCAFPNTPKFRQVQADCGTIVSKEWISDCHSQKKLVDIESYLMHAGKPWRRSSVAQEGGKAVLAESKASSSRRSQKQDGGSHLIVTAAAVTNKKESHPAKACLSPSKVKKWAIDDLNSTISWLECQEEKPEPSEIKKIAAEGILTCLQDAIDSLEQKQEVRKITEEWKVVPRVVEELAKLEGMGENGALIPKEDLYKQAMECKRVYETELGSLEDDESLQKKKKPKTGERKKIGERGKGYDSDETIEMTEEEIDRAYNTVSSKLHKY
ncbi:BRCT domain containing protein [Parasponia andersonii]|uniref:BRCT domain containing protein n=1 Tax=Parasponia andersonii TaxID=3476 RepID=A0A2P5CZ75_PARAD|nr:BRCT domain containing protein [Parasponia andersonii]